MIDNLKIAGLCVAGAVGVCIAMIPAIFVYTAIVHFVIKYW